MVTRMTNTGRAAYWGALAADAAGKGFENLAVVYARMAARSALVFLHNGGRV